METYFTKVLKIKRVLFCLLYSESFPFSFIWILYVARDIHIKQVHETFANCLSAFLSTNCPFGAAFFLGLFEVGTWS